MTNDVELESWRRQWQTRSASAGDSGAAERLQQRVLRETRWLKLGLVFPMLVTFAVGDAVLMRALRTAQALDVLLAVEVWIFIVVIWVGAFWIARGTWRPLADTTAAFVDVSIRRREANLRGATFGACLYVLQLVFLVVALGAASPDGIVSVLTSTRIIVVGWVGAPTGLAALYWFRRRQRAELERLRELERQLRSD
jgi:hypothetical protein